MQQLARDYTNLDQMSPALIHYLGKGRITIPQEKSKKMFFLPYQKKQFMLNESARVHRIFRESQNIPPAAELYKDQTGTRPKERTSRESKDFPFVTPYLAQESLDLSCPDFL